MTTASEQLVALGRKRDELQSKYRSLITEQSTIKQKIEYYERVIQDGTSDSDTALQKSIYEKAKSELPNLNSQLTQNQQDQVTAKQEWNAAQQETTDFINENNQKLADEQKQQLSQQNAEKAADPTSTVKSPENTNESQSDKTSQERQQNAQIVGNTSADTEFGDLESAQKFQQEAPQREAANELDRESRRGLANNPGGLGANGVPPGAEPRRVKAATAQFKDSRGNIKGVDLRVKLRVPAEYIVSPGITNTLPLEDLGGIVFPYTPSISYSHNADYTTQNPLHSNFSQNFYKNSYVTKITVTGKFTVQNDKDAEIYIATIQLLRALTKMRSGGRKQDPYSGSPPPVCRLDAYGDYMMTNVPVAVTEFKLEVGENVDYFTFGKLGFTDNISSVPTISTITIVLAPMYSRAEIQKFSVTAWLDSYLKARREGYL